MSTLTEREEIRFADAWIDALTLAGLDASSTALAGQPWGIQNAVYRSNCDQWSTERTSYRAPEGAKYSDEYMWLFSRWHEIAQQCGFDTKHGHQFQASQDWHPRFFGWLIVTDDGDTKLALEAFSEVAAEPNSSAFERAYRQWREQNPDISFVGGESFRKGRISTQFQGQNPARLNDLSADGLWITVKLVGGSVTPLRNYRTLAEAKRGHAECVEQMRQQEKGALGRIFGKRR